MVEHWFYHLQQSALEPVLADILEKCQGKKWDCCVCIGPHNGDMQEQIDKLDRYLWSYKDNSFLAHGREDEPMAEHQTILLSTQGVPDQHYDVVILVAGAPLDNIGFVSNPVTRCITILDGQNDQDRSIARKRWQDAKAKNLAVRYWKQDEWGKWVQPDI
jgi:DNA polymerase-3 subunit chi